MITAKGPWSVAARKVKGHATKEMVDKGAVRQIDKEGNDHADEAAGYGSKFEQSSLNTLTTLYAKRHVAYQKIMARVHRFIIAVKKAESELWNRKGIEEHPLPMTQGRRKSNKLRCESMLEYPREDDNTPAAAVRASESNAGACQPDGSTQTIQAMRLKINRIRREDC